MGVQLKRLQILELYSESSTVLLYSILFFLVMLAFAGFSFFVIKHSHRKGYAISYAVMLCLSFVALGAIAIMTPQVNGKYK
jgi:putative copper export protein